MCNIWYIYGHMYELDSPHVLVWYVLGTLLARVRGDATIPKKSTFHFFSPIFVNGGGGVIKNHFFLKFEKVQIILGGWTSTIWDIFFYCSPNSVDMIMKSSNSGRNLLIFSVSPNIEQQAWKTFWRSSIGHLREAQRLKDIGEYKNDQNWFLQG